MIKIKFAFAVVSFCFLMSCKSSIKPAELYGKWRYIKVEHPTANPPDSLTNAELQAAAPSIEFSKSNQFIINWGGKVLSHGKFTLDGMNILIKEDLTDGTTRNFPFWVTELNDKEIVFETKGDEKSRVTAVKE